MWQRSSICKLQYQTYWHEPQSGPDPDDPHIAWIREFYGEMYANCGGVADPARDGTNNVETATSTIPMWI